MLQWDGLERLTTLFSFLMNPGAVMHLVHLQEWHNSVPCKLSIYQCQLLPQISNPETYCGTSLQIQGLYLVFKVSSTQSYGFTTHTLPLFTVSLKNLSYILVCVSISEILIIHELPCGVVWSLGQLQCRIQTIDLCSVFTGCVVESKLIWPGCWHLSSVLIRGWMAEPHGELLGTDVVCFM